MSNFIPAFSFAVNMVKFLRFQMVDIFKAWMGNKLENGELISNDTAKALALSKYCPCHRVLESAVLVLKTAKSLDSRLQEKQSVNNFYDALDRIQRSCIDWNGFDGKTVIVVEGLNGSGKSSVIQKITTMSSAICVVTAHTIKEIASVRSIFHGMPASVSQAFDYVTNYFVVNEILRSDPAKTVFFVEEFHHAVCVSCVCETVSSVDSIEQLSKATFEWPFDLPLPELVLFLAVSTEIRLQRLEWSNSTKNPSAAAIKDAKENLVYSKVCGPTTVGIDASGSLDEVVGIVFAAFDYYGVHLPRTMTSDGTTGGTTDSSSSSTEVSPSHGGVTLKRTASEFDDTSSLSAFPRDNRRISMGVYGMFSSERSVDATNLRGT